MGYEYTIKFEIDAVEEVEELLKALAHFQGVKLLENRKQFYYRSPNNSGQLPNGLAEIQEHGVYFCDYGEGAEILKELVFRIGLGYKTLEVIDFNEASA